MRRFDRGFQQRLDALATLGEQCAGVVDEAYPEGDEVDKHMAELRGGMAIGLAIELKAPDAKGKRPKPTANQLKWLADLRQCGWRVEVCYSIDEVLAVLKECYPHKFK